MKLSNLYSFLNKDLAQIEDRLSKTITAEQPTLHDASLQLLQAGGKRIRPVFVLLSAGFGDEPKVNEDVKTVAVALELIHMATLVHDDVVDDAAIRRGKPTIKHQYGNRVAMYTGDYMLARALEVITEVGNPKIHQLLSDTLIKVVKGEIDQIEDKYNLNQNLRDYLRRIKRKTALLIATSCELGAIASGADEKTSKALFRYGYHVGMSFQIIDDILDFIASKEELGKPTGSDLMQGNITLPVLYALNDGDFSNRLAILFEQQSEISEESIAPILDSLLEMNVIEDTYKVSNLYLKKALDDIADLKRGKHKKTLLTIAAYIGKRRI